MKPVNQLYQIESVHAQKVIRKPIPNIPTSTVRKMSGFEKIYLIF